MDDWKQWVGRTWTGEALLDPAQADRMAVTLDRAPGFTAGTPLPPAWHWLYFHEFAEASSLGRDGHPALGVTMPPLPLTRRMWAGGHLRFDVPLVLGEKATRTSTISAVTPKHGRTGPLFFVTVEHELGSGGRVCVREKQTIVYRDLTPRSRESGPRAPEEADFTRTWSLDSTAIFRYSALTFNGHRIHYDVDYARDVEGYPGLVVHGPLLATLLMDLAARNGGRLATFEYRARSPLFVPEAVRTSGRFSGDGSQQLWASALDGRLAMDATATFLPSARS